MLQIGSAIVREQTGEMSGMHLLSRDFLTIIFGHIATSARYEICQSADVVFLCWSGVGTRELSIQVLRNRKIGLSRVEKPTDTPFGMRFAECHLVASCSCSFIRYLRRAANHNALNSGEVGVLVKRGYELHNNISLTGHPFRPHLPAGRPHSGSAVQLHLQPLRVSGIE
jgi:hypothetical protein